MKTILSSVFAAGLAFALFAEESIPEGAIVNVGAEGRVAFVAGCECDMPLLTEVATNMGRILTIDIGAERGAWTLATAADAFAKTKARVAVFVTEDATLPISLVALEARWGVVNKRGLKEGQLRTEVMRVALLLLGASCSRYEGSAMYPTFSAADLEKNKGALTVDTVMAVFQTLEKLGIKQYRQLCYRDACYEGVAPSPKTEQERKIYEAVKKAVREYEAANGKKK